MWGWYTISAVHTFSFWLSLRKWKKLQGQNQVAQVEMRENRRTSTPSNLESNFGSVRESEDTRLASQVMMQTEDKDKPKSWLESWPRPFQVAHVLLWSTIATFVSERVNRCFSPVVELTISLFPKTLHPP